MSIVRRDVTTQDWVILAPDREDKEFFLWHIEIVPRLATPAGFELGSGMAINTVLPEEAAAYLRSVKITSGA